MRPDLRWFTRSAVAYSVTGMWVGASLIACMIAGGWLRLDLGLVALLLLAVLMVLAGQARDVKTIHTLVNSQRDLLLERIDELEAALRASDTAVPAGEGKVP